MKDKVYRLAFLIVAFGVFVTEYSGRFVEFVSDRIPGAYLVGRFTLLPAMKLPSLTEFGFSDDVHTANREPIEDIVARVKLRRI